MSHSLPWLNSATLSSVAVPLLNKRIADGYDTVYLFSAGGSSKKVNPGLETGSPMQRRTQLAAADLSRKMDSVF
jgi:hypothetical protein